MYGSLKIPKCEKPDASPYTVIYPHSLPVENRKDNRKYKQYISIDPARKNLALRIERRYDDDNIVPIVFNKVAVESSRIEGDATINDTYKILTAFLDQYLDFYDDCHYVVVERQLPQNYKCTRIAQHIISYYSIKLFNKPLLPAIIELDPKAKGKYLGAPKGITDKQLKTWAIEVGRNLLTKRKDNFSLSVMDSFKGKQDDLADTICQIEALCVCWGLKLTEEKIIDIPKTLTLNCNDNANDASKTLLLNCNDKVPKIAVAESKIEEIKTQDFSKNSKVISTGDNVFSKEYIMSLSRVVDVKNVITTKKLDIKNGGTIAISKVNLTTLEEYKKIIIDKLYPS